MKYLAKILCELIFALWHERAVIFNTDRRERAAKQSLLFPRTFAAFTMARNYQQQVWRYRPGGERREEGGSMVMQNGPSATEYLRRFSAAGTRGRGMDHSERGRVKKLKHTGGSDRTIYELNFLARARARSSFHPLYCPPETNITQR